MDGILVSVLQLQSEGASVTETPYTSLKSLSSIMSLIGPKQFKIIANDVGLMAIEEKFITLETGKSFYIGTYQKMQITIAWSPARKRCAQLMRDINPDKYLDFDKKPDKKFTIIYVC